MFFLALQYVFFYSLWSFYLIPYWNAWMYFKLLLLLVYVIVMSNFLEDKDDFSLCGLTQEGHEVDVTVISDSDDNYYEGLLAFIKALEIAKNEKLTSKSDNSMLVAKAMTDSNAKGVSRL